MSLSIRLLSTALLCASIQGWPGTASAQEGRVVVRGFEGPGSARVRTQVVRATSAKVPICGRPLGPNPVSKSTGRSPEGLRCLTICAASWKGQAR